MTTIATYRTLLVEWIIDVRRCLEDVSTEMRARGRGDSRFQMLIGRMPDSAVHAAMGDWQPIETAPSGVEVLVHYTNRAGKHRIVKARHIERFTEESDPGCEGVDEYDEANDRYTYCEGWWECIDNWDDFGFIVINEGSPDAWQPLPTSPAALAAAPAATP